LIPRSALILLLSAVATEVLPQRLVFALFDFFLLKCLVPAWNLLIFPELLTLNLFLALEFVFIFGIAYNFGSAKVILFTQTRRNYFFFFIGDIKTIILRPSNLGSVSAPPTSASSLINLSNRSSPRSLKTIVLPLK